MKKVFIVMINYNGEKDTIECLDSFMDLKTEGFNVSTIVVDNPADSFQTGSATASGRRDYPENRIKVDEGKY